MHPSCILWILSRWDPSAIFQRRLARSSHVDLKREQHPELPFRAMMRLMSTCRPSTLPPDLLACYPFHKRPSLSDIQELVVKTQLHKTDDDIVLLVRNPTIPLTRADEPNSVGRAACLHNDKRVRIYVSLLMRPWIMQVCHSAPYFHPGTTRTLRMLERYYCWIGMSVCTRWRLCHYLRCQARITREYS